MNKDMIKKNLFSFVRLRPMAKFCKLDQFGTLQMQDKDDDWAINFIDNKAIEIINNRTRHVATLGYDHIHSYMSDPENSKHDSRKHGFFNLNVQIYFGFCGVRIEPIRR